MSSVKSAKSETDRAWKHLQQVWKETNASLSDDLANSAATIVKLEEQIKDLKIELAGKDLEVTARLEGKDQDIRELRDMLQRAMAVIGVVRSTSGIAYALEKDRRFRKCVRKYDQYMVKHVLLVADLYPDRPEGTAEVESDSDSEADADDEREEPDLEKTPRPPPPPSASKGKGKAVC